MSFESRRRIYGPLSTEQIQNAERDDFTARRKARIQQVRKLEKERAKLLVSKGKERREERRKIQFETKTLNEFKGKEGDLLSNLSNIKKSERNAKRVSFAKYAIELADKKQKSNEKKRKVYNENKAVERGEKATELASLMKSHSNESRARHEAIERRKVLGNFANEGRNKVLKYKTTDACKNQMKWNMLVTESIAKAEEMRTVFENEISSLDFTKTRFFLDPKPKGFFLKSSDCKSKSTNSPNNDGYNKKAHTHEDDKSGLVNEKCPPPLIFPESPMKESKSCLEIAPTIEPKELIDKIKKFDVGDENKVSNKCVLDPKDIPKLRAAAREISKMKSQIKVNRLIKKYGHLTLTEESNDGRQVSKSVKSDKMVDKITNTCVQFDNNSCQVSKYKEVSVQTTPVTDASTYTDINRVGKDKDEETNRIVLLEIESEDEKIDSMLSGNEHKKKESVLSVQQDNGKRAPLSVEDDTRNKESTRSVEVTADIEEMKTRECAKKCSIGTQTNNAGDQTNSVEYDESNIALDKISAIEMKARDNTEKQETVYEDKLSKTSKIENNQTMSKETKECSLNFEESKLSEMIEQGRLAAEEILLNLRNKASLNSTSINKDLLLDSSKIEDSEEYKINSFDVDSEKSLSLRNIPVYRSNAPETLSKLSTPSIDQKSSLDDINTRMKESIDRELDNLREYGIEMQGFSSKIDSSVRFSPFIKQPFHDSFDSKPSVVVDNNESPLKIDLSKPEETYVTQDDTKDRIRKLEFKLIEMLASISEDSVEHLVTSIDKLSIKPKLIGKDVYDTSYNNVNRLDESNEKIDSEGNKSLVFSTPGIIKRNFQDSEVTASPIQLEKMDEKNFDNEDKDLSYSLSHISSIESPPKIDTSDLNTPSDRTKEIKSKGDAVLHMEDVDSQSFKKMERVFRDKLHTESLESLPDDFIPILGSSINSGLDHPAAHALKSCSKESANQEEDIIKSASKKLEAKRLREKMKEYDRKNRELLRKKVSAKKNIKRSSRKNVK